MVVDHILVGVTNSQMPVRRTKDQAKNRVAEIQAMLAQGGDWDALKREYSDDPPPGGPYTMVNHGLSGLGLERPREDMVTSFGDVSFRLAVGEIGVAVYDRDKCPYGYHIIKRLE